MKKYPTKRCVHCYGVKGIRKETRFKCGGCNVALHRHHCFSAYHAIRNFH